MAHGRQRLRRRARLHGERREAEPLGEFCIRPVPLAGRFALQLETPRQVRPCKVLGYLGEVPRELTP